MSKKTQCDISPANILTECRCCINYPNCDCPRKPKLNDPFEVERQKRMTDKVGEYAPKPKRKPLPTNYTPPKKKRKKKGRGK